AVSWGRCAGLLAEAPRQLTVADCRFTNHAYACIIARAIRSQGEGIRIVDNDFQDYGLAKARRSATALIMYGVSGGRISNVTIRGNRFIRGCAGQLAAIALSDVDRAEIDGNCIYDHANTYESGVTSTIKGIDVLGSTDVQVCRNQATGVVDETWRRGASDSDSAVQFGFAFAATGCRRLVIADHTASGVWAGMGAFDNVDFTTTGNTIVGDADGATEVAAGCGLEVNSNDLGASGPACGCIVANTFRNLRTGVFLAYGRDIVISGNV